MKYHNVIVVLAGVVALFASSGCSDDETSAPCVDYSDVTGSPSLEDDVMPIFQQSCNFSSCHSSDSATPQESLALGPPNGTDPIGDDIDKVHSNIVGVSSIRSELGLVAAGDPGASWLLAKMEYTDFSVCSVNACESSAKGCGTRMPANNPQLDRAALDTVAAWIKAGALNN